MSLKGVLIITVCLLLMGHDVYATHGAQSVGYSVKSMGMGGVGAAYAQDTLISAVNPAGMYWVPNEFDVGLTIFSPHRRYRYTGTPGGIPADDVKSGRNYFFIPNLGYSQCCFGTVLGVSVYGQGGLNTSYPRNNPAFGQRRLGVDYLVATIAPTLAFPLFPGFLNCHSVGIAPLIGIQTIKLAGLNNFEAFSSDPPHVTNNKYDWAVGIGVRVGWMGKLIPCFLNRGAIWGGAAYATQVLMTHFKKYRGLFADHGRINNPANFTVGLRWAIDPCINLCFDYNRILYSGVRAFHNSIEPLFQGIPLGDKNGAGFGWNDVSVYKVGADYVLGSKWKIRAGGSFGNIPYRARDIDSNIIAPAVIKSHLTLGATWRCRCHEFDFAYVYAFRNHISGRSRFGLGEITETMYQHHFALNYHLNF